MFSSINVEKIKRLLLIGIGCMTIMMVYYIWLYNAEKPHVKPQFVSLPGEADSSDDVPNVVVNNIELTETSETRILWTLRAKEAKIYSTRKETLMKDVEVDFFDEQGKSMSLTSDRGRKDDKTGNIVVSGNVLATSLHEGITLKTSELWYNADTQKITSDKHVIIDRGNMITSGEGLESDMSLEGARILRNVTTSLVVEEEQ